MINNKVYTVTTADYNSAGEIIEQVRDFPKSREGLESAYKFAQPCHDWIIWHGNDVVGDSTRDLAK
jgi:hypothetical protein